MIEPVVGGLLAALCPVLACMGVAVQRGSPARTRVGPGARSVPRLLRVGAGPASLVRPLLGLRVLALTSARRRARLADAEIPQLLDLLAAASSAGLAGPLALRRAAGAVRGPLAEEVGAAIAAVDLGARWRDELRKAAERLGLRDLRRAVAVLTRVETLGSSLANALEDLAGQVRASRRAAVAERARRAPVKMLFPLVFLVLPAFLLLTVVPVLVATLRSIR